MVQTVKSWILLPGENKMFIEKPLVLHRIYFKISALLPLSSNYSSKISFDDPVFYTYYTLVASNLYFEAKGEGISQGNIWVQNVSTIVVTYTTTEILI